MKWKSENIDVERHSLKRVENYFTDSLLYQDSLEDDKNPPPEELDSCNEADTEQEEDECLWEINHLVTSIDELDVDATANIEGEWFVNED